MTDAELVARLRANMVAYKRFQAELGPMRALVLPGVWAFAQPQLPDQPHPQQVLYEDVGALEAALPEIEGFYREHRVPLWRVQVPIGDTAAAHLLRHAGMHPRETDATPAMGLSLTEGTLPAPRVPLERLRNQEELIPLNAKAFEAHSRIVSHPWHVRSFPQLHILGLREGNRLLSAGMAHDLGETAGIYLVATANEARGRGLASEVMRGLLADAQARGCTAAVLQATELGYGVYRRLGFRDLGRWISWVFPPR
ncbi:GNAT family N-acetyltransferase [Hyalangium rubrum]|uniref:GNAT family N-acetyltransferase n=1 Tax=Hyalangium rubrum TaxID=3103134 RepID=A0ABU5GZ64_9BACT|nr:GNAT family N-acetyltransferase [Hyalangium sp. s54d21]MDY7226351.1 GNAT family N-acetyltransferase [Hyalangium sp. s54d21]